MDDAKRKRIAAKGWLSRAFKQIEKLLLESEISETELSDSIVEFESRLRILDETQCEVERVIDLEELEADIERESVYRNEKRQVLLKAKEYLMKYKKNDDSPSENSRDHALSHGETKTKLPTLELPKFGGNYTQWQTFWEKFSAAVDSSSIPEVNKFTYLQSVLEGDAAASIKGLSLTADNYSTAKDILLRRFGKPERIIFGHIQNLLKTNVRSSDSSVASLWKLHDDIQTNVRSLHNLGVGGDTYGVILTPLILHQLPPNIRLEWARVGEDREGDLNFLLQFLNDEIRRRERSLTFGGSALSAPSHAPGMRRASGKNTTASALLTSSPSRTCVFCHGTDHYSDQCGEIKNLDFEGRKEKIKRLGLCFRCLKKHMAKDCTKLCYFCKDKHHSVLCRKRFVKLNETQSKTVQATAEHDGDSAPFGVVFAKTENKTTIMQVVNTEIHGSRVTIMFDSGSDRSFIRTECARKMKLDVVGSENLAYSCFAANEVRESKKDVFELDVRGEKIRLVGMEKICATMYRSPVPMSLLKQFEGIDFTENYDRGRQVHIDILIGLDWYWPLIKYQSDVVGGGIVAQETVFGWMLSGVYSHSGPLDKHQERKRVTTYFCQSTVVEDKTIRRLWELDSIGITDDRKDDCASGNQLLNSFNDKIQYDQERYTVQLLWKSEETKRSLMCNRKQAEKRLHNLMRRLEKNTELKERYNDVFRAWEEEDIIEEVMATESESGSGDQPMFYLPHRPVIREDKSTTKVRPVFDASCQGENGISLNDCMETGPNMIPDLTEILVRFRRWKYGLTSDITKAFLQIKLQPSDQNVHRFLWDVNGQIRTMRFKRVIFGNACSPFLLNATVKFHLSKFQPSLAVKELTENLYMDDWLTGADTDREIHEMMNEAEVVMKQGGFPMTKWASNCQNAKNEFLKTFDGFKDVDSVKVLGLTWITTDDSFAFQTIPLDEDCLFTKRSLLGLAARLFDPLGLLTPFTINLKILFQEAWKIGYEWDDVLPIEFQDKLQIWLRGLDILKTWRIPRCIALIAWNDCNDKELLVFADASERAYGCCLYLKTTREGQSSVSLVMSKVRVAPLKKITLPRLELLAALLASRLLNFGATALQLEPNFAYTCFTDSQIVLSWIKSDAHRWKQFVSNRVQEIQGRTNPEKWKHCPGKENPADLLTRGIKAQELMGSSLWLNGPDWLKEDRESVEEPLEDDDTREVLEVEECRNNLPLASVVVKKSPVIEYDRFSSITKIVRIMAYVCRFVKNCKPGEKTLNDLSGEELDVGKVAVLRDIQREFYCEEIKDIQSKGAVKKSSSIHKLSPFMGQRGLLRVSGRLDFAPSLMYDEKHPIILPKCYISFLIVRAQHLLMKHVGVNTLISTLRNSYWIVSVRTLAKKVCKKCFDCQKQDARPLEQITAPLPEDRVKKAPPFSVVGVDHAGPLFCSDIPNQKLYILIFTCAVIRAIHIELVDSLSLDDFILAFKRFSARRGRPSIIYSDNAKTFKGAYNLLQREMSHLTIEWKFSAPLSPWWGGWWERMIRTVKASLKKSLAQRLITRIELETTLQEVEACVNSRPLTYVEETGIPLTPSHFLIGRSSPMNPTAVGEFCEEMLDVGLRGKCQSLVVDTFWNIWKEHYIRNLPPIRIQKEKHDIKIGTLVLVRDDNKPRLKWPIGVVTKIFPGKDGLCRAVELNTNKGLITRAVQRLHKLEMMDNYSDDMGHNHDSSQSDSVVSDSNGRDPTYTTRSGRQIRRNVKLDL